MRISKPIFAEVGALVESLGITPETRVTALVGGGGKTSLMYSLAAEMVERGKKVVTSTTTKICAPEFKESPCLILLKDDPTLRGLPDSLREFGQVTVGASVDASTGKLTGIDSVSIERCLESADHVIVEADGSARRSIKAPEAWEPVIPPSANLVVAVVGMDCIGKPVSDQSVFRWERFTQITGLRNGDIITPMSVARLLAHPEGGLKGVPTSADLVVFLNKKDLVKDERVLEETVAAVLDLAGARVRSVVLGQLKGTDDLPRGGGGRGKSEGESCRSG